MSSGRGVVGGGWWFGGGLGGLGFAVVRGGLGVVVFVLEDGQVWLLGFRRRIAGVGAVVLVQRVFLWISGTFW